MPYRDNDSEETNEVFLESGLENGLYSEEKEHECSSKFLWWTVWMSELPLCEDN